MFKHQVSALLCVGSLLLLPACSQSDGGEDESAKATPAPAPAEGGATQVEKPSTGDRSGPSKSARALGGDNTTPSLSNTTAKSTTAPDAKQVKQAPSVVAGAGAVLPDMDGFVVKADPIHLQIGEIPLEDTGSAVLKFTNHGTEARKLLDFQTTCGCTTPDFPKGKVLEPGESIEVTVKMKGGRSPRRIDKTLTFMIEGQDPMAIPVSGEAVSYVALEPLRLDPKVHEDGRMTFTSQDGTPFTIMSMTPEVIESFPTEPAVEHVVYFDWEKWEDLGSRRKLTFYFDHPKCVRLYSDVVLPQVARSTAAAGDQAFKASPTETSSSSVAAVMSADRMIRAGQSDKLVDLIASGEMEVEKSDRVGNSVLAVAAKHGDVVVMEAALDAGADREMPGQLGRTPIMFAAESKNLEAVQLLLDEGADVSARDQIGGTALTWGAAMGTPEIVEVILDAGADVNAAGNFTGWTPLIWASLSGQAESITVLLEAGAPVDIADQIEGATPLMHAVRTANDDCARILLDAGADLESKDNIGRTVLLMASSTSGATADTIKMLLAAGADPTAKDRRGESALDLARKRTDVRAAAVAEVLAAARGETVTEEAGASEGSD